MNYYLAHVHFLMKHVNHLESSTTPGYLLHLVRANTDASAETKIRDYYLAKNDPNSIMYTITQIELTIAIE